MDDQSSLGSGILARDPVNVQCPSPRSQADDVGPSLYPQTVDAAWYKDPAEGSSSAFSQAQTQSTSTFQVSLSGGEEPTCECQLSGSFSKAIATHSFDSGWASPAVCTRSSPESQDITLHNRCLIYGTYPTPMSPRRYASQPTLSSPAPNRFQHPFQPHTSVWPDRGLIPLRQYLRPGYQSQRGNEKNIATVVKYGGTRVQPWIDIDLNSREKVKIGIEVSETSSLKGRYHPCSVCAKRFTRPSALRTHMHTHTGERPFICDWPGCGRDFSVQSNCKRHIRTHEAKEARKKEEAGEINRTSKISFPVEHQCQRSNTSPCFPTSLHLRVCPLLTFHVLPKSTQKQQFRW
ncbi:hypothetical protein AYX15_02667 [Cryptococcus neoformans]|nr:hypothetical protein AYX15_02667 [Cryptococcus neoformans var. grubii]